MQSEILEKYPEAKLKVFVVWEPMLPTDRLRRTRDDVITDARAIHFKDLGQVTGKWFAEHLKDCPKLGDVAWDAMYVYGADAKWEEIPGPTLACATPIVAGTETFMEAIEPLLAE